MSDAAPSFLTPPEQKAQPELLPTTAADSFFGELENKGEFTGERLFQQRPDTYKAIVVLLGQKLGVIRIGKLLGVSPNTVMAVRDREGATVDIVKEHLARVAHAGATLASEGMLEALNNILQHPDCLAVKDLKDLAVVYGILVQNAQLLSGQPTARLEVSTKPEHDDWNAYVASLKSAHPAETHLEGEKSGGKEGAAGATGATGAAGVSGASGAEVQACGLIVSQSISSENQ